MALSPGTRLGPYEIAALIGEGGMGQVYRGRDTKLDRDVALKVLPDSFSHDSDRLARFEREAKVLASLNHPNIAHIHGLEESNAVKALVMELVEGEDLAQRLSRGAIPIDEALPLAKQIAEALEAAHEQGIIHRDLKPANIKVRPDGTVKVLDFGLAKAFDPIGSNTGNATMSPTLSIHATQAGIILGTAAYMSPEQARGRAVDKRSDVWSFGCVVYEMLAGRHTFNGDDISMTLATVLKGEPDWRALPEAVSPSLRQMLHRCLVKDPKDRLRDIGEARIVLASTGARAGEEPHPTRVPTPSSPRRLAWPVAVIAAAIAFAVVGAWIGRGFVSPAPPSIVARIPIRLPADLFMTSPNRRRIAVSPDGSRIAFVGNNRLYLQSLADRDAVPVAGTENPVGGIGYPVFSPDGQSLAFYTAGDGALKRVPIGGGAAVTICPVDPPSTVNWDEDDTITVTESTRGVQRVRATGGTPETLTASSKNELMAGGQILPDGEHVLYAATPVTAATAATDLWARGRLVVESVKTHERKTLLEGVADPRYLPTGHILYASGGVLFAIRFDARRLAVVGAAVPVVEGVARGTSATQVSVSPRGTLAFIPGPTDSSGGQSDLALIDDHGTIQSLGLPRGNYQVARISPDGKRIAFGSDDGKDAAVWVYELGAGTAARRLTVTGHNRFPIWSADSERVAFQSDRDGDSGIFWQRADGVGIAERLTTAGKSESHIPEAWLPKGDAFLFASQKDGVYRSFLFSMDAKRAEPFASVQSANPINAVFSPDGKWVAYTQLAVGTTGFTTMYVQPFPPTGGTVYQLTRSENAHFPVWSRDGKALFYVPGPGRFASISTIVQPTFTFADPVPAPMVGFLEGGPTYVRSYDVMPDGKRVIGTVPAGVQSANATRLPNIEVIVNWFEVLKSRVPNTQ
jgi:serine/threonine-protein kinase